MKALVSIIVPCYKQAEYLPETLNSVSSQTYQEWECIIVNDGSPDNTAEIAKEYCDKDTRFKYLFQENSGLAAARNAGIAHTDGFYILPLDADDLIAEDYLEQAVSFFDKNPLCKLVYCKAKKIGFENCEWNLPPYSYDTLLWRNCIFCSGIFKRKDFLLTPGYNSNMIYGWEDWDFWLSLLNSNDIVHQLDSVKFYYRTKQKSMITEANNKNKILYRQVYHNHKELYGELENRELELYAKSKYLEQEVFDILHSRSYKIYNVLFSPIRKIKQILNL